MNMLPEWAANESKRGRTEKYPLGTMDLYAVHTVPAAEVPGNGLISIKVLLNNRGRILGRKFVCRQLEDGTVEICRVI